MDDKNKNNVPLECPSNQNQTKVEPIVNTVEKEIFPPVTEDILNIISK